MANIIIQDIYIRKDCVSKDTLSNLQYNIFYLQKKIYQAAKECHHSLVQSLQKLLVSLYSAKKLADKIAKNKLYHLEKNFVNYNQKNIPIQRSTLLLETNKQLILWCLEPEWHTKIKFHSMTQKFNEVELANNKIDYACSCKQQASLKHINKQYLLIKLKAIRWIAKAMDEFFYNQFFIQAVNSTLYNSLIVDHLQNLINLILLNGLEWLYFRQAISVMKKTVYRQVFCSYLKKNIYLCTINSLVISAAKIIINFFSKIGLTVIYYKSQNLWSLKSIKLCDQTTAFKMKQLKSCVYHSIYQQISNNLFINIRNILYHKDKFGRTRTNNNLSVEIVSFNLNNLLSQSSVYYLKINNKHKINPINKKVDKVIYLWSRKKYKKQTNSRLKYFISTIRMVG
uniref:hypothetical protein n=1 Tax=Rhodochorton tenue TaxID=173034 RepID=UPI002A82DE12|nr:hypothetical protein UYM82_pgp049 [Rhodochorton tenue]WOK79526.1 hypothetical protein [Rhodochorton tenue]